VEVEWPTEAVPLGAVDEAWEQVVEVRLRCHSGMSDEQRLTVEADYQMKSGVLKVKVRRAMQRYLLKHLGLEPERAWQGPWFELVE
jgi:hypothetical protein